MALKDLRVNIGANTSGFDQGLKKVKTGMVGLKGEASKTTSGLSRMAGGFKSALKAGLAMAGITFGLKALSDGVKAFVGLESSVVRTGDLFGSASKNITYFAENTGKAFGIAETSAYQYAAVYGNLFKNITSGAQENSAVTIAMLKASAVVSSKTGRTMEDVMERIRSGLLGNTEAIEDLGINVNVAMLQTTAAFKKIANSRSWEQLTFYEQQQIRTLGILKQAHKNYGDAVEKGSAYNLSTFGGALKDMATYAGQFVNAGLQPIIKALTQIVQSATAGMKSLASLMGLKIGTGDDTKATDKQTAAQAALTNEVNATAKAKQKLSGVDEINTLSSDTSADTGVAGASTGSVFSDIATPDYAVTAPDTSWVAPVKSTLSDLANFIKTKFGPSISEWGKAFASLKAPAAKAFDSVKNSAVGLWKNTLAPFGNYVISDWIPSVTNGFSETFAPIFEDTMPVAMSEWTKDFDFACKEIDRITKDIFKPAMDFMKGVALDAFGGIKSAWDEHGAGILDGFTKFKDSLRDIWNNLYENVFKPVFGYIGDTVSWLWDKHLKPLWDNISEFVGSLIEFVLMLWNQFLSPFINWIVQRFGPPIAFIIGMIDDVFGTVFGVISDVVGAFMKYLSGFMDFLTGVFTGNWDKAWKGIKKMFGAVFDGIYGVFKGVVNLIIDGLNGLWGGIYNVAKGVVDSIGGIAGAIGKVFGQDWKFSLPAEVPKIPKLATGGVVSSPTVAMIGEAGKEAVMPLENNTGWIDQLAAKLSAAGGVGGDTNLTAYIVLDDGTVVGRTTQRISRGSRMGGAPILGV